MYHSTQDQRSMRSREMLYEGLAKLIQQKNFSAITVTDLVTAANVGRTTFYRNFDQIEDVLWMRCDQVVEGLINYLLEYRQTHPNEPTTTVLKPILHYFYQHSELIELLIKAKRVYIFEEILLSRFEPFKGMFKAFYRMEEDYVDYMMVARIGGLTKVLLHWIETGKKQTPDQLAEKLSTISSDMVALNRLL